MSLVQANISVQIGPCSVARAAAGLQNRGLKEWLVGPEKGLRRCVQFRYTEVDLGGNSGCKGEEVGKDEVGLGDIVETRLAQQKASYRGGTMGTACGQV